MNTILAALSGTIGLAVAAILVILLTGTFVLWRARRKLRQTT
jgi:hypothetical protein